MSGLVNVDSSLKNGLPFLLMKLEAVQCKSPNACCYLFIHANEDMCSGVVVVVEVISPAVGKIASVRGPLLTKLTFLWLFFLKIYISRLIKSLSVLNKKHAIAKVISLLPLTSYR